MALAPADYYAYSQATGTPFPESPQERASLAPEVLNFRRNQLKAPQAEQGGPDPLSLGIGIGLGLAGIGGVAYGAKRFLGGRQRIPKAPPTSANTGTVVQDLEKVVNYGKTSPSSVSASQAPTPSQVAPDLVDIQQATTGFTAKQQQTAGESGSNQELTRMKSKLQRNEDLDTSTVAQFLAEERDEIASQLGEQGLSLSPGRIERELATRVGPTGWEYGPEYTKTKHAMELGTQDPKFMNDLEAETITLGGTDFELGLQNVMSDDPGTAFRRPVINESTALAADQRYQLKQNSIKDWLGSKRLESQQDIVRINNEQSSIKNRMNQLREEENMLMYSSAQSPGNRMRNSERLDQVQGELEDLVDQYDFTNQQLNRINNRIAGAQNFAQNALEDVTKTLPTTLTDWSGEGFIVRPKAQTSSTFIDSEGKTFDVFEDVSKAANFEPGDLEVVSGRRKVVENLVSDPETGALMQAASGTSIRGRSGIPFISEAEEQEMGMRAKEAASKIAYVESLQPVGVATTSKPAQANVPFGVESKGGIGIYGIEAEGYPAGAVISEGEYTRQATQRPTYTSSAVRQSPPDVLEVDRQTGERRVTRKPGPLEQSPLLDLSDDQLNEMVLMGNAAGGEAQQIGMEAERVLRYRGEASSLERQKQNLSSIRMSEAVRRASQMSAARNPRGGILPDEITMTRRQMAALEPTEITYGPRTPLSQAPSGSIPPQQLGLKGVTGYAARQVKSPADIAAEQLESYMSKLQRGRSTPLTSQAVIQPKLF